MIERDNIFSRLRSWQAFVQNCMHLIKQFWQISSVPVNLIQPAGFYIRFVIFWVMFYNYNFVLFAKHRNQHNNSFFFKSKFIISVELTTYYVIFSISSFSAISHSHKFDETLNDFKGIFMIFQYWVHISSYSSKMVRII